jgi:hypothetical protein
MAYYNNIFMLSRESMLTKLILLFILLVKSNMEVLRMSKGLIVILIILLLTGAACAEAVKGIPLIKTDSGLMSVKGLPLFKAEESKGAQLEVVFLTIVLDNRTTVNATTVYNNTTVVAATSPAEEEEAKEDAVSRQSTPMPQPMWQPAPWPIIGHGPERRVIVIP